MFQFPKAKGKMKVGWCRSINLCRACFMWKLSHWITTKVKLVEHSEFGNGKGRDIINEVLETVQVQSYSSFRISTSGSVGKIPLHGEIISEFGKTRYLATWTWHCSASRLDKVLHIWWHVASGRNPQQKEAVNTLLCLLSMLVSRVLVVCCPWGKAEVADILETCWFYC